MQCERGPAREGRPSSRPDATSARASTPGVRAPTGTMPGMDPRPLPDPAKLLSDWMEWETGETTPGRVMANLKTGGMRELLEELASKIPPAG